MMSRIASRLKRLEKAVGERGACHCGRGGKPGAAFYYPDEGQAEPSSVCPSCGGKRMIIAIVYESWQSPSHGAAEQPPLMEPFEQFSQPARYE
jgi:hypothetical protein